MKKGLWISLAMTAVFICSCQGANITGTWDSVSEENGKFKRYHFTEQGGFSIDRCKASPSEEGKGSGDSTWELILRLVLQKLSEGKQGNKQEAQKEEDPRCVEFMKGEYKIIQFCDTPVNCILKPQHKITLTPKGGFRGVLAKLSGPAEMDLVKKGKRLTLGGELLTRVITKNSSWKDLF